MTTQADSQTIEVLASAFYGAIFSHDYEGAAAFLTEDAELHEPSDLQYGGVHYGPEAMVKVFATVAPMVDPTTIVMEAFLEEGNRGMALASSNAVTGERLEAIEEFIVRDGKIARVRVFLHECGPMIRAYEAVHGS